MLMVEQKVPETVLQEKAIKSIQNKDTLDVYGRRLRGTSALISRAVIAVGIPTLAAELLQASGTQTFSVDATLYTLGGAAISTLIYGAGRLSEKKQASQAEEAQQIIRDTLDEPVDVIRNKRKRHKKSRELTLRWYGADTQMSNGNNPDNLPGRFSKIIDFADQHAISSVVVSTKLFDLGDTPSLTEKYRQNLTSTNKLLQAEKGVGITDRMADPSLVRLSIKDAKEILAQLQTEKEISRFEAIAEWFNKLKLVQQHPFVAAYQEWKQHGKAEELKKPLTNIMRSSLERHFSGDFALPVLVEKIRVHSDLLVTVSPEGVFLTQSPRITNATENHNSVEFVSFSHMVGGNVDHFINDLLERRGKRLAPHEMWKLELSIYHLLTHNDTKSAIAHAAQDQEASPAVSKTKTLYTRMQNERPRTKVTWPHLPERGKVKSEDQTIAYGKRSRRTLATKSASLVLAAAIGYGGGAAWGFEAGKALAYDRANHCITLSQIKSPSKAAKEKAACNTTTARLDNILRSGRQDSDRVNTDLANVFRTKWYESGIPMPNSLKPSGVGKGPMLFTGIINKWGNANIYGHGTSEVGNVPKNKNYPVWTLDPINGAKTEGYWPTNVQNHITVTTEPGIGNLPPFANLIIQFDNQSEVAPSGIQLTTQQRPEFARTLSLPKSPTDMTKPLIGVSGAQSLVGDTNISQSAQKDSKGTNFQVYSLPVIQGGDIVAANFVVRNLISNKVIDTPPFHVYQRNDGTFYALVPLNEQLPGYLSLNYWVEPNASTALPVQAVYPISTSINKLLNGGKSIPLTQALSRMDTAKLDRELGLAPYSSAANIAGFIKQTHTYNLDPSTIGINHLISPTNLSLSQILLREAEYEIKLPSLNCNETTLSEVIASSGRDNTGFVNPVLGFRNGSDNTLSQSDSHEWTITNGIKGSKIIDGTPESNKVETAKVQTINVPPVPNDALGREIEEGAAALGLLGFGFYGNRRLRPVVASIRKDAAQKYFQGNKPELERGLRILGQLLYAQPGSAIDEDFQPRDRIRAERRTGAERLLTIPPVKRSDARRIIAERGSGLSYAAKRDIKTIYSKAATARREH